MSTHELSGQETDAPTAMTLEADEKTAKKARWGSFAFVLPTAGKVNVANHSHGSDVVHEHTYTVTVDAGGPIECSCPHYEYRCGPGEACKHMVAVTETEPVLAAALRSVAEDREDDDPEICTDGGQVLETGADTERPAACICLSRSEGLACFPCWNAGFETPNPDAPTDEEEM